MSAPDRNGLPERISPAAAARICGIHQRTLIIHAERGEIPGAARLFKGGHWTFDEARLRAWIREREAAASGTPGSKFVAATYAAAYERLMLGKPVGGLKIGCTEPSGKRNSGPRPPKQKKPPSQG